MFRLLMAVAFALLLWIQSLFTHTVHIVDGNRHLYCYGPVAWVFVIAFYVLVLGFSLLAWKWLKDRGAAILLLVLSPLMLFAALPQILSERVELTETEWRNRREWPHSKYSADVPWGEIKEVTKVRREDLSFGQTWRIGYEIALNNGRHVTFPSSTTMTAAEPMIDAILKERNIPMASRDILVPKER